MTDRIQKMRRFFVEEKRHHALRQPAREAEPLCESFARSGMPPLARAQRRVHAIIDNELPVVFPDERIVLMRTVQETPCLFTEAEYQALRAAHWIHESGDFNNFCPDYGAVLAKGFSGLRRELDASRSAHAQDAEALAFLDAMQDMMDCLSSLASRYRETALAVGNTTAAAVLARVPEQPAETLLEALQFLRLLNYGLWCANNYQCALGRLDQTLYPYYRHDLDAALCTDEEALELIEEFFLSLNRDSDLYDGVQQGDNGQSLVLGGRDQNGDDAYNALSALMLQACLELKLIDPKLNLRVDANTPPSRFEKATELTREGLGFPQYLNDDVLIPALLRWGYAPEDAYRYAVAACWEPIIPGCGTDVVNADGLNFPNAVLSVLNRTDDSPGSYPEFLTAVCGQVRADARAICERLTDLYVFPAPMVSFMMDGCIENARDAAQGCKYNNTGIHGVGISTAADSLAAVRTFVYGSGELTLSALRSALQNDFRDLPLLQNRLRCDAPKMGCDDDETDAAATALLDAFADALEPLRNAQGGCFRAGTGTAMYYLWFGRAVPATPDGRNAGDPLPANDSPSLFARVKGPVSVIKSFTKQHLVRVANGGPLTLELHNSVFRSADSIEKVAALVRLFILRGGHQLQLNAVNRDDLLAAQKNPDAYRNLIVRVWGWSGYFVELDKAFQDQIIQRAELVI